MANAGEDKKTKRAVANVNERRRMQNINSGFEALREIITLPNKAKLSKSAILRHTAEMIGNLISENQQLKEQNTFLRNLVNNKPLLQKECYSQCNTTSTQKYLAQSAINNLDANNYFIKPLAPPDSKSYKESAHTNGVNGEELLTTTTGRKRNHSETFRRNSVTMDTAKEKSSPKKYSAHVERLLSSPRRSTRSSVINYAYTQHESEPFESPTRRSSRLLAKDLLTPPGSGSTRSKFTPDGEPAVRDERSTPERPATPADVKGIAPRSAKRSLDAIIQAIDHLENT